MHTYVLVTTTHLGLPLPPTIDWLPKFHPPAGPVPLSTHPSSNFHQFSICLSIYLPTHLLFHSSRHGTLPTHFLALCHHLPTPPVAWGDSWLLHLGFHAHLPICPSTHPFICSPCQLPLDSNQLCCRWDISLVSNAPIGIGFGPQNITVIMSQESHHRHAFLIRISETYFPHALKTAT